MEILQEDVLAKMSNKHRLLTLLINKCGLRTGEAISLKFGQFDYEARILKIEGKKGRNIAIEEELYEAIRAYVHEVQPKNLEQYIFPSTDKEKEGEHISRFAVNKYLQRFAHKNDLKHITPRVLKTENAFVAKETSEEFEKIEIIEKVEKEKTKPRPKTLREIIANHKHHHQPQTAIPLNLQQVAEVPQNLFIARDKEIERANGLLKRGINLIITGEIGVGKTKFIDQLQYPLPTIVLDDTKDFKKSLANAIIHLLGGEEEAREKVFGTATNEEIYAKVTKESMINLSEILCQLVPKKSHILRISDVSDVTPLIIRILKERLVEHFIIVTTAREIRKDRADFLWTFERMELKNLKRDDSIQLIYQLSEKLPIEDFTYTKNKIYQVSQGNPRMINQICERIAREFGLIQNHIVESIANSYLGKRTREIDMSFLFLALCLIVFAVVWYRTDAERELLRFARFGIVIFVVFGRAFFRNFKRKVI